MHRDLLLNKITDILGATEESYEAKLVSMCDDAKRIFITGAGRSKLVGNFLGMRLMHSGYETYVQGEVATPSIRSGDLLIVISGSGETTQLVSFANKAKSEGAKVILICSKSKSTIGDIADQTVQIGNDGSFATTKGLPMGTMFELSTLIFLEATISYLIHEKGIAEEDMRYRHANME
ncbi:6-phospho-3-hexuloisomerase [Methylophaga frappieri]|uniref:6-phospho-3-hexuloisomerase n=1 Tax=Methylophaga frappieri (strain ATCC BAA-2434 / DSM 25690 / JAM7) TaxID=754477 RepID=I1YIT7_METFJ|nr:6-phospho-3-hexuloisomerase [Methylophaga frappieri]AFJ02830.1 6-phospho-3-hexuloisomerase [Methylophaga frappieri]